MVLLKGCSWVSSELVVVTLGVLADLTLFLTSSQFSVLIIKQMPPIIMSLWTNVFYAPILQALIFFYHLTGNSFGLAIIALTAIIRGISFPLSLPAMKSQKKLQALAPELSALKKKHKEKAELQKAQLELYKSHGVNPGAGCLPQILQILILIALYNVFTNFIHGGQIDGSMINMNFLWLDLSKPDQLYILPVLAGVTQLLYSLMLRPGTEHPHPKEKQDTKKEKKEEKNEMEMAEEIQSQMMFMMPAMTLIISFQFASGLTLYWVVTTVFSIIQQWLVTGPGGLRYYWAVVMQKLRPVTA